MFSCLSSRYCENCLRGSPLGSAVLRFTSIFEPSRMSLLQREKLREKLKVLLRCFIEKATNDFKFFLAEDLSKCAAEFQSFSAERNGLDNFYFSTIQICNYQKLSLVLKLLLTLSHGQALVERGFSLNNNILKTNTCPKIVIAKRLITDHMVMYLKPHIIEIT